MMIAANRGMGDSIATPDVCLTPGATGADPIPYVNDATNAQATGYSETVKVSMMNALTLLTSISSSSGDEAGTSSPNRGKATFTSGDPAVYIDGVAAVRLTSTTSQNGVNAVGAVTVPSLTTVLFSEASSAQSSQGCTRVAGDGRWTVRVPRFVYDTPTQLVRWAEAPGVWVIDLRGNPGGDLDAALDAAALFVARDTTLARVVDAAGERVVRARGAARITAPLLVCVDGATASAAELFAATLQHHGRALLVGAPSYGKCAVERHGYASSPLPVARWTLPDGTDFVRCTPDVPCAPEALAATLDALVALFAEGAGANP